MRVLIGLVTLLLLFLLCSCDEVDEYLQHHLAPLQEHLLNRESRGTEQRSLKKKKRQNKKKKKRSYKEKKRSGQKKKRTGKKKKRSSKCSRQVDARVITDECLQTALKYVAAASATVVNLDRQFKRYEHVVNIKYS